MRHWLAVALWTRSRRLVARCNAVDLTAQNGFAKKVQSMADIRPSGTTRDAQYGFSKVFVHDLDGMAAFYQEVFGFIPFMRHKDIMLGRQIDEITYQATYPGGSSLTLIKYSDSTRPTAGESVQGFTTSDIEALVKRAKAAGGSLPEPIRRMDDMKLSVAFVLDPEGHVNEVVQLDPE